MSLDGQQDGFHALPQDVVLNPTHVGSLLVSVGPGSRQLLPVPPAGWLWWVNGEMQTGDDPVSYTLRAGIGPGTPPVAAGTIPANNEPGFDDESFLDGGVALDTGLFIDCNAELRLAFDVAMLPASFARAFVSQQLTDEFQVLALPAIPAGYVLREPFTGWSTYFGLGPRWFLNGPGNADSRLILQVQRGSLVMEFYAYLQVTENRYSQGVPLIPALLTGDIVRARVDVAPVGISRFGGLFQLTPQQGGF